MKLICCFNTYLSRFKFLFFKESPAEIESRRTTKQIPENSGPTRSQATFFGLISLALFAPGVLLFMRSKKNAQKLEKYEFEHRTAGGVVQFDAYEDALRHKREKAATNLLANFALLLIFFGVFGFLFTGCVGLVAT